MHRRVSRPAVTEPGASPVGSYVDITGAIAATPCPGGLTTAVLGAVSVSDNV